MAIAIKKGLVDFGGHLVAEDTAKAITWLRATLAKGPMLKTEILEYNAVRSTDKRFSPYAIDKAADYLDVMRTRQQNTFQPKVIWELPSIKIDHGKRFSDPGTSPTIGAPITIDAIKELMAPEFKELTPMTTTEALLEFARTNGLTIDEIWSKTVKPNGEHFSKSSIVKMFNGTAPASKFMIVCMANSFNVLIEDLVGSFDNFKVLSTGQYRGGNRSSIGVINDYFRAHAIDYNVGEDEVAENDRIRMAKSAQIPRFQLDPELNVALHIKLENGVMTLSYANGVSISVTSFDGDVSV